ncbi:MAG: phosphate/phosphite/phosphonate ABC transporter substrate-binding protein [Gammaproteobacteria bacterium]|nr:phosphate/phosphite/phosphonate ABC transporter substrate-binding protein [Gammaproteobacteria bacterium]
MTRQRYNFIGTIVAIFFGVISSVEAEVPLIFGVHPYMSNAKLEQKFTPLIHYLEAKTGQPIELKIGRNYTEHIDAIGNDRIDIAYIGPAPFISMVNKYGKKNILAKLEINGDSHFRGRIIAHQESKLKSLAELKGRHFAFGDESSTMSHLVPRYMLIQAGITVGKDIQHSFLNSHENVALGVLVGDFDAGAIKDEVFIKFQSRGIKEIASTPPISSHLIITRTDLPDATNRILQEALFSLKDSPSGEQIMGSIRSGMSAFVPADEEDYANLKTIIDSLNQAGIH